MNSGQRSSAASLAALFSYARLSVVLLGACLGCGRGGIPVAGTVSVAGKPVTEGTITFEPADGKGTTVGAMIHEGQYRVGKEAGMQPGKKLAHIMAVYKTGQQVAVGTPSPPGTMADEIKTISPAAEACEVSLGPENRLDFDVGQ
jgi:hypothetical protein